VVARCHAGSRVLGSACAATSRVCQEAARNSLRIDGGSGYVSTCNLEERMKGRLESPPSAAVPGGFAALVWHHTRDEGRQKIS